MPFAVCRFAPCRLPVCRLPFTAGRLPFAGLPLLTLHDFLIFRFLPAILIFAVLKRIGGILLVTVYMLSFAELHNLLRIPIFFEHLQEHYDKDPETTVWGFISEHYLGPIVVDDDFDRDQQLPFRDANCGMIINYSCECREVFFEIDRPEISDFEFSLYKEANRGLLTASDFFQPPRRA
ncbi:MAG: hypothetical protein NVV59_05830 [Chitinophagaceae bacterium]|nr:hypothetical protein [Chitinophagaceae bacterium]